MNLAKKKILPFVVMLVCLTARGQNNEGKPHQALPPQVKQTVNAIAGTWSGLMTAKVPGFPQETFTWTMDCRPVALGAGASCTNAGKASIGLLAESCLLAYDPEGKAVHYLCVTSMGEVHDHKGQWTDERTIEFEPLQGGMMGKPVTETNRWAFPDANTIDKTSIVTLSDGSSMTFEFIGKRRRLMLGKTN